MIVQILNYGSDFIRAQDVMNLQTTATDFTASELKKYM